jgi:hypothetical protein
MTPTLAAAVLIGTAAAGRRQFAEAHPIIAAAAVRLSLQWQRPAQVR